MVPYSFDIRLDLFRDFQNVMERVLRGWGQAVDENASFEDVCVQFFNLEHRLVKAAPRRLEISKELSCPPEYRVGFNALCRKIQLGEDLTPHLSAGVTRYEWDMLLNDWGIHHLHLSTEMQPNSRFVKRDDPVLFVRFTDEVAYLIDIMGHGNWSNQELLRILHRNWPDELPGRLNGVLTERQFTNEEIALLRGPSRRNRGGRVSTAIEIEPESVYFSPGMGYSTNGTSMAVMFRVDDCTANLRRYEEHIRKNIHIFYDGVRKVLNDNPACLSFIMATDFEMVSVYETSSKVFFPIGPLVTR